MDGGGPKRLLNAGSGPTNGATHRGFDQSIWKEVRIDIDPLNAPDLVGSVSDMRAVVEDESFDAIWSSHCIEHLYDHEVLPALREFRRILRTDGFAIISCPNLEAIAKQVVSKDIESVAYLSPAGAIRFLDMIFGHSRSIETGHVYMTHKTGFTSERLGRLAVRAGFTEARVLEGDNLDLWAALMMPKAEAPALEALFEDTNIASLFSDRTTSGNRVLDAMRHRRIHILRTGSS